MQKLDGDYRIAQICSTTSLKYFPLHLSKVSSHMSGGSWLLLSLIGDNGFEFLQEGSISDSLQAKQKYG